MGKYSESPSNKKVARSRARMLISLDVHKRYSLMGQEMVTSGSKRHVRIDHERGAIRRALVGTPRGTRVAVEATGNWYWVIDEIEQAGLTPLLVHPGKAKSIMAQVNKTDKLDVDGLNRLQRNKVLPTVWIPPADLRDLREVTRVRMSLAAQRTQIKNRIHATFSKYNLRVEASDAYGKKGREQMEALLELLPPQTVWAVRVQLYQLDFTVSQLKAQEKRVQELMTVTPAMQLLATMPGVGTLLAGILALEIGDIERFPSARHLASYCGTTPRVHSSGGRIRYGHLRNDVNMYLKWAFSEAANSIAVNKDRFPNRYASELYKRLRFKRDHSKAIGAVARHLAESAYYVLRRNEPYLERGILAPAARAPH